MKTEKILAGSYVLIVDDEQDVLDTIVEFLDMCKLDTALSYTEAKKLMAKNRYDIAVLDIMGVDGYELLKIANSRKIPALMLTAHALSRDNLIRSGKEGAAYYAPKDEITQVATFLADVIQAIDQGKNPWQRMVHRLGKFYDKKFHGTAWRQQELDYLEDIITHSPQAEGVNYFEYRPNE